MIQSCSFCFSFLVFSYSQIIFSLCSVQRKCCYCYCVRRVYFIQLTFGKQICAVDSNVLLNEMFTLFCDQSSNSASRHSSLSIRLSFSHNHSLAYKTQTHLVGIITRHSIMHHAFRCALCLFVYFLFSIIQMRKSLVCAQGV